MASYRKSFALLLWMILSLQHAASEVTVTELELITETNDLTKNLKDMVLETRQSFDELEQELNQLIESRASIKNVKDLKRGLEKALHNHRMNVDFRLDSLIESLQESEKEMGRVIEKMVEKDEELEQLELAYERNSKRVRDIEMNVHRQSNAITEDMRREYVKLRDWELEHEKEDEKSRSTAEKLNLELQAISEAAEEQAAAQAALEVELRTHAASVMHNVNSSSNTSMWFFFIFFEIFLVASLVLIRKIEKSHQKLF